MQKRTDGIGYAKGDRQNKTSITEQAAQDRQNKRTRQAE
jgi:hypothetical protein